MKNKGLITLNITNYVNFILIISPSISCDYIKLCNDYYVHIPFISKQK